MERFKNPDNDQNGPWQSVSLKTYSQETFDRLKAEGKLIPPVREGAGWRYKWYLHETKGKQVEDIWTDINLTNPMAAERMGYPTQKPEALLERIIKASSNEGDLIELTDFSVYYTQGAAEAAAASLKNGKSEVVCEQGQLIKVSKDKDGVVTREKLTKHWTDWVDYWAVDFDYMSRKEIIKVAVETDTSSTPALLPEGEGSDVASPSGRGRREAPGEGEFEERWTGSYIFENEWQSFRTRKNRDLEFISAPHAYTKAGRHTVAVKVIDIFGNDTITLVPVNVG